MTLEVFQQFSSSIYVLFFSTRIDTHTLKDFCVLVVRRSVGKKED